MLSGYGLPLDKREGWVPSLRSGRELCSRVTGCLSAGLLFGYFCASLVIEGVFGLTVCAVAYFLPFEVGGPSPVHYVPFRSEGGKGGFAFKKL